jgi:hypothetical protein
MKKYTSILLAASFMLLLILFGCDDSNPTNIVIPSKNVSYAKYIQPLFNISCAISGCHDNSTAAGGLALISWSTTVANPQIVFPFNADNSMLVWAIQGRAGTNPMPPINSTIPPLTQNQVNGIITWINEGAQNN